ncbi:MAG: hypothetical protein H2B00_07910 [Nitrosopumilaceae archaeon]|jgi:hypothetical protein|uniref:Uncharacterized protein n=2 Tax=Candidatus Nitrosomaritimum aestuariumsis TaxID=3342354 RepID=A0AC60W9V9_9ARCH|nr:hypothetical protein [Nitrosopumilaceae archaeon]MBA4460522.1 hypothetical protein [Nitrosopumilaceae archaeon]MBA4462418.1 hypothetical protein [Nitrosopumilaceae archaeon]MBA4463566.1 hypothetical protein [Nitrosopumilaceae archaeon]
MNQAERELLDKLDKLVMDASGDELKKIQELDLETQLDGTSFYDAYLDSRALVNQTIKKESSDSK